MKTTILSLLVMAGASSFCLAQAPGEPAANGLPPTTTTYFINSLGNTNASGVNTNGPSEPVNNGKVESLGVSIAANGNVVVGWEDDAGPNPLLDYEAVWTLFDANGKLITTSTAQTADQVPGETVTNKWLSYFRADGSAVVGATSWGPKIKGNLFGDGFGMGATSYGLSENIAALAPWDDANSGDFPSVQLLNNSGAPVSEPPRPLRRPFTPSSQVWRILSAHDDEENGGKMNNIFFRVMAALVLVAAIVGIGFFAYNAGAAHSAVINVPAPGAETATQPYPYFGYGMRFGHPYPFLGFGCLGLLLPLFLLFLAFGAFRRLLWGPRWGWRHMQHGPWRYGEGGSGVPPMFAEWHKRAHGESDPDKKE